MSKHTPGPWHYEKATKTIRSEPANYWLATMDSWDGAVADHSEANARLIAAAPDMLAALRWAEPVIRDWFNKHPHCQHDQGGLDAVSAAIAKADGEKITA